MKDPLNDVKIALDCYASAHKALAKARFEEVEQELIDRAVTNCATSRHDVLNEIEKYDNRRLT